LLNCALAEFGLTVFFLFPLPSIVVVIVVGLFVATLFMPQTSLPFTNPHLKSTFTIASKTDDGADPRMAGEEAGAGVLSKTTENIESKMT